MGAARAAKVGGPRRPVRARRILHGGGGVARDRSGVAVHTVGGVHAARHVECGHHADWGHGNRDPRNLEAEAASLHGREGRRHVRAHKHLLVQLLQPNVLPTHRLARVEVEHHE